MDQSDHDVVAARLMRFRDENGDRWADGIDLLSLHPVLRRAAVRVFAELDAAGVKVGAKPRPGRKRTQTKGLERISRVA